MDRGYASEALLHEPAFEAVAQRVELEGLRETVRQRLDAREGGEAETN